MKPMMYKAVFLLLGVIFTLSSCLKHDSVFQPVQKTGDLKVPDGFDWASSRAVSFTVSSPVATTASFFLDEKCTPASQLAALLVSEGETEFTFDVPKVNKAVYIQYPLEKGGVKTLTYEISQLKAKAGEDASVDIMFADQPKWTQGPDDKPIIYIPGGEGKYGTLMFEDNWPGTGDYDFNDFVVNYKIVSTWDYTDKIDINVSLKFRALGGSLPYDFAIQIGKTHSWDADNGGFFRAEDMQEITEVQSTDEAVTVEKLEGTVYPAVIVKGLNSLRSEEFYNTVHKDGDGVTISFKIRLKADNAQQQFTTGLTSSPAFDYFLINESTHKEIHMIGFSPTALYKGYDADFTSAGDHYYQNKDNFVWGLKVPEVIGWARERQDILNVYTKFGYWVTEGGYALESNNVNPLKWYDKKWVNEKLIFQ